MRDVSAEILFQSFLRDASMRFSNGQRRPFYDVVHPALETGLCCTLLTVIRSGRGVLIQADLPRPAGVTHDVIPSRVRYWLRARFCLLVWR